MKKDIEDELQRLILLNNNKMTYGVMVTLVGMYGVHPKQVWATLGKWERKGIYDYGTSMPGGWLNKEKL